MWESCSTLATSAATSVGVIRYACSFRRSECGSNMVRLQLPQQRMWESYSALATSAGSSVGVLQYACNFRRSKCGSHTVRLQLSQEQVWESYSALAASAGTDVGVVQCSCNFRRSGCVGSKDPHLMNVIRRESRLLSGERTTEESRKTCRDSSIAPAGAGSHSE